MDDMGIKNPANHSVFPAMKQNVTMLSLALNHLARENRGVSFSHTNPGMVNTDVHSKWLAELGNGFASKVIRFAASWMVLPLMHAMGRTPGQAGEVGLFAMANGRFGAASGKDFWRLGELADEEKKVELLERYEGDGTGVKVWEHTLEVFREVVGR